MSKVALAPGCAREYETVYILRPNLEKEKADHVAKRVGEAIKGTGGILTAVELWGSRRLAYPIQRHHRGIYIYLKFLGKGDTVAELERQLKLADSVIRYQTIQLRSNVPISGGEAPPEAELALDFDLPDEPDEPELTRERELGLDTPATDRRRRGDRDHHRDHHPRDRDREREAADAEQEEAGEDDSPAAKPEAAAPASGPDAGKDVEEKG